MFSDAQCLPLSELVELCTGRVVGQKDPNLPYIGLEHIAQGEPFLLGMAPSGTSVSTNSVFEVGDILFGKLRPNLRKSLQVQFKGYCSTDILVLRARKGTHPGFAARVFQSDAVFDAAVRTAIGTKMPRTSWEYLKTFQVFVPPFPEQRCIAEVLDATDEAIQQSELLIAKLRAIKAGLLHDLLTRGLDEHGRLRDPQAHPEQFKDSPLGRIPQKWEVKGLPELMEPHIGVKPGPFGSSITKSMYTSEGYRVYGQEQVIAGDLSVGDYYISRSKYLELQSFAIQEGDLLISLVGTIGELLVVRSPFEPGVINPRLIRLRPDRSECDVEFLKHALGSALVYKQLSRMAQGGTMPVLSGKVLRKLRLTKPPSDEQRRIAVVLDEHDARIGTEEAALEKLRQVKRGLMDDLLTGKVRVASE